MRARFQLCAINFIALQFRHCWRVSNLGGIGRLNHILQGPPRKFFWSLQFFSFGRSHRPTLKYVRLCETECSNPSKAWLKFSRPPHPRSFALSLSSQKQQPQTAPRSRPTMFENFRQDLIAALLEFTGTVCCSRSLNPHKN